MTVEDEDSWWANLPEDWLPGRYVIAEGQTLVNVHPVWQCAGRACVIHSPSDHRMQNWPKGWDDEGKHFNRFCQHRVAHPDPDDVEYWLTRGQDISVHACDGCCIDPADREY